jgi:hypothetical protein
MDALPDHRLDLGALVLERRPQATRFLTGGLKKQLMAEEWPRVRAVMEGREPDLSEAVVKPDPPILLIGIGVLAVLAGLALIFGQL